MTRPLPMAAPRPKLHPMTGRRLFVYGTLRPHHGALNRIIPMTWVTNHEPATLPGHTVYDTGNGYPALFADPTATIPVRGDIITLNPTHETEAIATMDRYEGYHPAEPSLFQRATILAATATGIETPAETYLAGPLLTQHPDRLTLITTGEWARSAR